MSPIRENCELLNAIEVTMAEVVHECRSGFSRLTEVVTETVTYVMFRPGFDFPRFDYKDEQVGKVTLMVAEYLLMRYKGTGVTKQDQFQRALNLRVLAQTGLAA